MITQHTAWHVDRPSVVTVNALGKDDKTGDVLYQAIITPPRDMAFASSAFSLSLYGTANSIREAIGRLGEELATAELVYDQDNGRLGFQAAMEQ